MFVGDGVQEDDAADGFAGTDESVDACEGGFLSRCVVVVVGIGVDVGKAGDINQMYASGRVVDEGCILGCCRNKVIFVSIQVPELCCVA